MREQKNEVYVGKNVGILLIISGNCRKTYIIPL